MGGVATHLPFFCLSNLVLFDRNFTPILVKQPFFFFPSPPLMSWIELQSKRKGKKKDLERYVG
jgi:hypothetical protein